MAVPSVINISPSSSNSKAPMSSHRLPTISASHALQDLQTGTSKILSTGLASFDSSLNGGLEKGKVTEIWGPSGGGVTAIALQVAANTMSDMQVVLWIDGATKLSQPRVQSVLKATISSVEDEPRHLEKGLRSLSMPSLSHLLATILQPPPNLISPNTSLLVIDGLQSLIDVDYPRYQFATSTKAEQQKWQAGRRYAVLGSLVSALNKIAAVHNLSVIVTTGCSTRMRSESGLGAALVPGVGGAEWDSGIWNRLAVFRDFGGRFIGVQKSQGKSHVPRDEVGEVGRIFGFEIDITGIVKDLQDTSPVDETLVQQVRRTTSPQKPRKRIYDEIADSEDEDVDEYGWAGTDEDAIAAEGLIDTQSKDVEIDAV